MAEVVILKGLQLLRPEQVEEQVPERIGIYGRAGIGKSRTVLMLPDTDKWGEVIYYAADDNSEFLRSIPSSARTRVHVVKPRGDDHRMNFQEFCMRDWKPLFPNAKTLVVDTFTTVAFKVIQQIANSGIISREEHFMIGDPKAGGFSIPSRSDYQAIDSACKGFFDALFDKQRNYNILLVFHEDSKEIAKGVWAGGPMLPGRRMLEMIPADLNTILRLTRANTLVPGTQVPVPHVIVNTTNNGHYIAKVRESDLDNTSVLDQTVLDKNPTSWWVKYDEFMKGNR